MFTVRLGRRSEVILTGLPCGSEGSRSYATECAVDPNRRTTRSAKTRTGTAEEMELVQIAVRGR
jgi:hypothetical protein